MAMVMGMRGWGLVSPLVLGLLLVSCSETKIDRCNRLVSISNRTTEAIQKLPAANLKPADRFTQAADLLDRASQDLQNLKLSDSKLADFQQQLSELYRQDAENNRQLATLQDAKTARLAGDKIQKNSITQKNLVQSVNTHCQAPES